MSRRRLRSLLVAAALAVLVSGVVAGSNLFASTNADFTGQWSLVDLITAGPNKGQSYPWQGTWTQSGTSLTGTGGYTIVGTVSGSTATFTTTSGGSYVANFTLTMSADGKSLTGTCYDNQGRSCTVTATGSGKPPTETQTTTTQTTTTTTAPASSGPPPLPAIDPAKATGRMQSLSGSGLTVIRDGKRYTATKDSLLQVGDVLETDKNTVVALEFLIGGRVGINKSSQVKIVSDRNVSGSQTAPRVKIESGSMWAQTARQKANENQGQVYRPLEIQTNGGVMGIRG